MPRRPLLDAIAIAAALLAGCRGPGPEPKPAATRSDTEAAAAPAEAAPAPTPATGPADSAADVIRRYYAAIRAHDYRRAYALWGDEGRASGQTLAEFEAGFRETETVRVDPGEPGRVEGAAGSRFVRVPVVVRATTTTGDTQRFEGTYTLRRVVVDGASEAQREWHIYAADLRPSR